MGRLFEAPKPPPMPAPVVMPPPPTYPTLPSRMPYIMEPPAEERRKPTPPPAPHPAPAPIPGQPPAPPAPGQAGAGADGAPRRSPRRRWRPDTLATGWRGVLTPRDGGPRRKTLLGE